MTEEQRALVQQLGQAMSDVSEDCYYAGWLADSEYLIPELCHRASRMNQTVYWDMVLLLRRTRGS